MNWVLLIASWILILVGLIIFYRWVIRSFVVEPGKERKAYQEWYQDVMENGTTDEKILAELQAQNRQQRALSGLLGLWFLKS